MKKLEKLYEQTFGCSPEKTVRLAGAGSSREYFRMEGPGKSVIGTYGKEIRENRAFVYLSNLFSGKGLPVPGVISVSDDYSVYIQDDIGNDSLYGIISSARYDCDASLRLLESVIDTLADFHSRDYVTIDRSMLYPRAEMDRRSVTWDLNYFKYDFLKLTGVAFDEEILEECLEYLAETICGCQDRTLILRDFQSRNIMIHQGRPYVIDFQGARFGSGLYDVASFLWQTRLGLPEDMRWRLAERYLEAMSLRGMPLDEGWRKSLEIMVMFRMLQVLGTYGFRGLYEHKSEFVTAISKTLENLSNLISEPDDPRLEYLGGLVREILGMERFAPCHRQSGKLLVKVYSFSYRKGIPEDLSGNGGGFVFDCRAIHNPGRYDRYKPLTGRDPEVIEFLENDGEISVFLESCYALVDKAVEKYIRRGFTDLSVSFGCTGGRHRSVYSAEHLAHHLAECFDVEVELIHREQNISERLKWR